MLSTGGAAADRIRAPVGDVTGSGGRPDRRYGGAVHDEPIDPFANDPLDQVPALDDDEAEPLTEADRQSIIEDLADLDVFQTLLSPIGIRGLVVDCQDCREEHYFEWELLRANLRHLLSHDRPRVHERAFDPAPEDYVSWDYARGYRDGVEDTLNGENEE